MTAEELAEMIALLERAATYTANPAWERSFSEAAHRGRLLASLSSPRPPMPVDPAAGSVG